MKRSQTVAALGAFFFTGLAYAETYLFQQRIEGMKVVATVPSEAMESCQAIIDQHPKAPTGTYEVMIAGVAKDMHCNMDVDGGGWTPIYKQSQFTSGNAMSDAGYHSLLANTEFNGTTISGSLVRQIAHSETLLWADENTYIYLPVSLLDVDTYDFNIDDVGAVRTGIADSTRRIAIRSHIALSGIAMGMHASPWCSLTHGRYNGRCRNGNYGIGNWMIMVR